MSDTRTVETSAADIEAAIELGLKQLGVPRESVIVEILDEPSRGLLGLGARQARVRLTTAALPRTAVPAASPEPEIEMAAADPEAGEALAADAVATPESGEEEPHIYDDLTPVTRAEEDDDVQVSRATLEELLERMDLRAEIAVFRARAEAGEAAPWVLQIRGNDLGALIGRRGETLAALQYITRLIASRELQHRANIVLDVEGYKSRREKQLRRLAQRMAEQVVQTGRTVSLEPMPPYERRIVHLALRNHPHVYTESVGEGEHRKVTIVPNRR